MIRPGNTVRALTGKVGVVLAVGVPTSPGKNEPTKRVKVLLDPFIARLGPGAELEEIAGLEILYHLDDLKVIGQE